eukprot:06828.XXX_193270_193389_1 [CDS] Oithona nana genome sequencing.
MFDFNACCNGTERTSSIIWQFCCCFSSKIIVVDNWHAKI